jgi:hypothetical protein
MRVKYLYEAMLMAVFILLQACDQINSREISPVLPAEKPKPEREKIKEVSDSMFVYRVENNEAVIAGIKSFDPSLIGKMEFLLLVNT